MRWNLPVSNFLWLTALLPPLLQLWPLPADYAYWRPIFPVVYIAFWAYEEPRWVGGTAGLFYGFLVEQMAGVATGMYAIPSGLIALSITANYQRFQSFPQTQQTVYVFLMITAALLIAYAIAYWGTGESFWLLAVCGGLTSALTWVVLKQLFGRLVDRVLHHG